MADPLPVLVCVKEVKIVHDQLVIAQADLDAWVEAVERSTLY